MVRYRSSSCSRASCAGDSVIMGAIPSCQAVLPTWRRETASGASTLPYKGIANRSRRSPHRDGVAGRAGRALEAQGREDEREFVGAILGQFVEVQVLQQVDAVPRQ